MFYKVIMKTKLVNTEALLLGKCYNRVMFLWIFGHYIFVNYSIQNIVYVYICLKHLLKYIQLIH